MRKALFLAVVLLLLLLFSACTYLPVKTAEDVFRFQELAHIFALTESEIFDIYGEPDAENPASFLGLNANEFQYGKNVFRAEAASGYLYYVRLYDDSQDAPRGVKTGMQINEVVERFACGGDSTMYTSPDGEHYRLLYGTYEAGGDYGVIFYDGRMPILVEYSSEGCVFACGIRNGKVEYCEYSVE